MKQNIKVIGTMMAILMIFSLGNANAATRTNIDVGLVGTFEKNAGAYINSREYVSLYTASSNYPTLFTITDAAGIYSRYYDANVGVTMTVTQPESVKGPNTVFSLYLKSKTFHTLNNYSGILFH